MQDAFGVDRSDISKGMKPSKVCENCGGKLDPKTGDCVKCGVSKGIKPVNIDSMIRSGNSALYSRGMAARAGKMGMPTTGRQWRAFSPKPQAAKKKNQGLSWVRGIN